MTFLEIEFRLGTLLRSAGCQRYTAHRALADAAKCWREIRQDDMDHGETGEEPFFNFVVAESVGIFALYDTGVDFYVIRGEERDFRDRFEPLAMNEVEKARKILASEFEREVPDLTVEAELSRRWLWRDSGAVG